MQISNSELTTTGNAPEKLTSDHVETGHNNNDYQISGSVECNPGVNCTWTCNGDTPCLLTNEASVDVSVETNTTGNVGTVGQCYKASGWGSCGDQQFETLKETNHHKEVLASYLIPCGLILMVALIICFTFLTYQQYSFVDATTEKE